MKRTFYIRLFLFLVLLSMLPFLCFDFLHASPARGFVSSGVKVGYDDGYLQLSNDYYFDSINRTVFDATNTVSGFSNNQLVFTLVNASANKYPSFTVITGSTKPVYILNVKNYSYSGDRTTFYGLSDSKTVTMDFGTIHRSGIKILQAPTIISAPSEPTIQEFEFTASSSGEESIKVECNEKPHFIKIDDVAHSEGDKWIYTSGILTITETFSSSKTFVLYWEPEPVYGQPTSTPTPTPTPTVAVPKSAWTLPAIVKSIQTHPTVIFFTNYMGPVFIFLGLVVACYGVYEEEEKVTMLGIILLVIGAVFIVLYLSNAGIIKIG